jgi:chaperonin GroES
MCFSLQTPKGFNLHNHGCNPWSMGATHGRYVNLLRQSTPPLYCVIKAKLITEVERSVATNAQSRLFARNQSIFSFMKKCLGICGFLASKNDNNSFIQLWYNISVLLHTQIRVTSIHTKTNNIMATSKKLSITPLHDRVIVKPAAAEEKTAGGIYIPDTAKEKPSKGVVMAAGPGKVDEPMTVKAGDTVLYGKYAGTEITIDGADLLIMRESDILAIV